MLRFAGKRSRVAVLVVLVLGCFSSREVAAQVPVYESLSDGGSLPPVMTRTDSLPSGEYGTQENVVPPAPAGNEGELLPPIVAPSQARGSVYSPQASSPASSISPPTALESSPSWMGEPLPAPEPPAPPSWPEFSPNTIVAGPSAGPAFPTPRAPVGGFYAGGEVVFARPYFGTGLDGYVPGLVWGTPTSTLLDYDYSATPRVWLGLRSADGAGLQCSYWLFDANGAGTLETMGGGGIGGVDPGGVDPGWGGGPGAPQMIMPTVQIATTDSLRADALDLHGTCHWTAGGLTLQGGAGVRYATYEQYFGATMNVETGWPNTSSQVALEAWRTFRGVGPSGLLELKRQIGVSRFSGFARGGGAVLFGTRSLAQTEWADVIPALGGDVVRSAALPLHSRSESNAVVGIGELAVGLEWSGQLANGDGLTVRGSYEGQRWSAGDETIFDLAGFAGFAAGLEWRH